MGEDQPGRRHPKIPRPLTTTPAALIVPAVPTFSVDKGFWYSIPEHLLTDIAIGTLVRVPLGGRKVRGFVIGLGDRDAKLKDVLGVSGEIPIFDERLLKSLQWAAQHYVAPLSVLLDKAAPPTLAKRTPIEHHSPVSVELDGGHPLAPLAATVATGKRHPATALVASATETTWMPALAPILNHAISVMVVAPTVAEAERAAKGVEEFYPGRVLLVPDATGSSVTKVWSGARRPGTILIGTPRVSAWQIPHLGLAVVLEESRRAMKDRQTPTLHVRDLLRTRSLFEGFSLLFVGPTPSVEVVAAGAEIVQPGRPWGLVEVVDRNDDAPGSGFVSERSVVALKAILQRGERAFVFTHIRSGDASARCVSCRQLRLCSRCGSQVGQRPACPRCLHPAGGCKNCGGTSFESMGSVPARIIGELNQRLGRDIAGAVDEDRLIIVGTERDLAGIAGVSLAIGVDIDALLFGHNYRASEEALRIVARLVGSVSRGKGNRTILQTSHPESELVATLRRGEPAPYLEGVLAARARDGFPPATEMLAFEARNADATEVHSILEATAPGMVMGPVDTATGTRWLLQGDLGLVKVDLRANVQRLRDSGATIRVDVDPIDI